MVVKSEVAAEAPSVFYYNDIDFTWSNEEKNKYRIIKRNIYTDLTNYLQNKITYLEDLLFFIRDNAYSEKIDRILKMYRKEEFENDYWGHEWQKEEDARNQYR